MGAERLHHLDALRALTMVLILPAHALALIGLRDGWNDVEASVFWTIHAFRLPLFFLVAGFFGALLVSTRGVASLLRNRAVRIGIPLAVGLVTAVPVLTLELQAIAETEYRPGGEGLAAFADLHPSFLWFLWYLMLFYAGALLVRRALAAMPAAKDVLLGAGQRLLLHWSAPILLAVPAAVLLYRQPTWLAETPADSFLPRPDLFAYYAIFFASGWLLFAAHELREAIESRPWHYAILGGLALPPALALYLLQSEPIGASRWFHLLALLLLSVTTWSLALGLLGVARHFLDRPSERLRYWADASYWIYLSHFPVMAALALVLFELAMPEAVRLVVLVVATLALIYPLYGAFVRHSAIGRVLHGPRPPRRSRRAASTALRRSPA